MTKTIQLLRGTTAQNNAFTGSVGELTIDTTTNELRVHDGSTAGGHIICTKIETENALKALVPAGTIVPWAGVSVPPAGYLYCDGSAVSRTTYADLFTAIGTYYGAGDGSTTFNLPNYTSWYMLSSDITIAGNGNFTLKANGTNRKVQWLDAKIQTNPTINQGVLGLSGAIPNSHTLYNTEYGSGLKCNTTLHGFNFCIKY